MTPHHPRSVNCAGRTTALVWKAPRIAVDSRKDLVMTPQTCVLARPSLRALFSLAVLVGAAWFSTAQISANVATGFFGLVSLDGDAAPAGTTVEVLIDGVPAGSTTVLVEGNYVIEMNSVAGEPGDRIAFLVDGATADQIGEFAAGTFVQLHLTAQSTAKKQQAAALPATTAPAGAQQAGALPASAAPVAAAAAPSSASKPSVAPAGTTAQAVASAPTTANPPSAAPAAAAPSAQQVTTAPSASVAAPAAATGPTSAPSAPAAAPVSAAAQQPAAAPTTPVSSAPTTASQPAAAPSAQQALAAPAAPVTGAAPATKPVDKPIEKPAGVGGKAPSAPSTAPAAAAPVAQSTLAAPAAPVSAPATTTAAAPSSTAPSNVATTPATASSPSESATAPGSATTQPAAGTGGGASPVALPSAGTSALADAGLTRTSLLGLGVLLTIAAIIVHGGWSSSRSMLRRTPAPVRAMPALRRTSGMAFCRTCGSTLHRADLFCSSCGRALYQFERRKC